MAFMQYIIGFFVDIAWFFYDLYQETRGWIFPFHYIADVFYALFRAFIGITSYLEDFNDWLYYIEYKIGQFLTFFDLEAWFEDWGNKILDAWYWIRDWWDNVTDVIDDWWSDTRRTVRGWIDIAEDWLLGLIRQAETWIGNLQSLWDNFITSILPTLANWTGINELIDSTLRNWFPWYDTLAALWNDIAEFFTDPPKWVYKRLDEFFERFW